MGPPLPSVGEGGFFLRESGTLEEPRDMVPPPPLWGGER